MRSSQISEAPGEIAGSKSLQSRPHSRPGPKSAPPSSIGGDAQPAAPVQDSRVHTLKSSQGKCSSQSIVSELQTAVEHVSHVWQSSSLRQPLPGKHGGPGPPQLVPSGGSQASTSGSVEPSPQNEADRC